MTARAGNEGVEAESVSFFTHQTPPSSCDELAPGMAASSRADSLLQPNGTVVFIVLLLGGSAMPDSRHKLRNAGRVFATNRETRIFAAKYA